MGSRAVVHWGYLGYLGLVGIPGVSGGLLGPAAGSTLPCSAAPAVSTGGFGSIGPVESTFLWHISVAAPVPSASTAFSWLGLTLPRAKCHWFVWDVGDAGSEP